MAELENPSQEIIERALKDIQAKLPGPLHSAIADVLRRDGDIKQLRRAITRYFAEAQHANRQD
jgi:hypothetical protein